MLHIHGDEQKQAFRNNLSFEINWHLLMGL